MPADTRTLSLGALQMATGNDNNNWGGNFNSDILAVLERAHCGVASRAVTGGYQLLPLIESLPSTGLIAQAFQPLRSRPTRQRSIRFRYVLFIVEVIS